MLCAMCMLFAEQRIHLRAAKRPKQASTRGLCCHAHGMGDAQRPGGVCCCLPFHCLAMHVCALIGCRQSEVGDVVTTTIQRVFGNNFKASLGLVSRVFETSFCFGDSTTCLGDSATCLHTWRALIADASS